MTYSLDSLPNVRFEQIDAAYDEHAVESLVSGSEVVINTIGISYEAEHTFVESFITAAKNIAFHAAKHKIPRLIKLTHLGAGLPL